MRPGITVQHHSLPKRRSGLVRCDITGMIAFIRAESWPEGATAGDFIELRLNRADQFWEHPRRFLFSATTSRSVGAFFENGGEQLHLLGVCIKDHADLLTDSSLEGVLAPLLERLLAEEDIALLVVPDAAFLGCTVARSGKVTAQVELLWLTLLSHCRKMGNRFLIMDPPRGLHDQQLVSLVEQVASRSPEIRAYGAIYYPWLYKRDQHYPPSGAMAGVYARSEREHRPMGVAWPPANVEVKGVTGLEVNLDFNESGDLAAEGVNPLIIQSARGVVVWGARTLSRDPTWQNINSRRTLSMVTEQLRRDNEWAVFETNNKKIWAMLEQNARNRLEEFWRAGLITSEAPKGDYLVQCDHQTNPPSTRNTGTLNVLVRLRPIGMTEHITIDLRLGENGV